MYIYIYYHAVIYHAILYESDVIWYQMVLFVALFLCNLKSHYYQYRSSRMH